MSRLATPLRGIEFDVPRNVRALCERYFPGRRTKYVGSDKIEFSADKINGALTITEAQTSKQRRWKPRAIRS